MDRSSVSRPLRHEGLKHTAVQARILSLLKGTRVQRPATYRGARAEHERILKPAE